MEIDLYFIVFRSEKVHFTYNWFSFYSILCKTCWKQVGKNVDNSRRCGAFFFSGQGLINIEQKVHLLHYETFVIFFFAFFDIKEFFFRHVSN